MASDDDFYTGETFATQDSREEGRRIRILARAAETKTGVARYLYQTVSHPHNAKRVGSHGHITAKTLGSKWTKVSH